jgi:hypothetical protein
MKPLAASMLCLVAVLTAVPSRAQTLTPEALQTFLESSAARHRSGESDDWESVLYRAAQANGSRDAVIEQFARMIGVAPAQAGGYAALIVEAAVRDEACEDEESRQANCVFAPGQPFYDRVASMARMDGTGKLLIAIGRRGGFTRQDDAAFFLLARTHPAAAAIFDAMFDWNQDPGMLLALLQAVPAVTEHAALVAATVSPRSFYLDSAEDSWFEALLESIERSSARAGATALARAGLAQLVIRRKLELGLTRAAVASYYAYPADVRALLPIPLRVCRAAAADCSDAAEAGYDLVDNLVAALWLTGHKQDAKRLLQDRVADFDSRHGESEQRYRALRDAMLPALRREDLFSLFIEGRLPAPPGPPEPGQTGPVLSEEDIRLIGHEGWLFQVSDSSPALRRVVAGRLRSAGHADMAAYLELPAYRSGGDRDPVFMALVSVSRGELETRQSFWNARIMRASRRDSDASDEGTLQVSTKSLPAWWVERPLPASLAGWSDSDVPEKPPADADLPIDPDAILRYEERGGTRALVYQSADYDLPGEVPAFGIWFVSTVGGRWSTPIYLGLQQHYPYVVTEGSRLALLDGGHLRVEVRVREIDSDTLSFPPVALGLKRSADGLYLDFDLAVLLRDRDKDGLTDIEEYRLGLDFTNRDTDGDGVLDGHDPLPLTRFRASGSTDALKLANAILSSTFGHDAAAIVTEAGRAPSLENAIGKPVGDALHAELRTGFLVADPAMFAGVTPRFRLLVYSPRDLRTLPRGSAPFLPPRVESIFSSLDGTTHYVVWSASWTGGAFIATCSVPGRPCSVRTVSRWIT